MSQPHHHGRRMLGVISIAQHTFSSRPPSSATPNCFSSGNVTAFRASTDKSTSSFVIPDRVRLNGVLLRDVDREERTQRAVREAVGKNCPSWGVTHYNRTTGLTEVVWKRKLACVWHGQGLQVSTYRSLEYFGVVYNSTTDSAVQVMSV